MKRLLFLALAALSFPGLAQTQIEGIGNIKLGKSKTEILDLLRPDYGKPKEYHKTSDGYVFGKDKQCIFKVMAPKEKYDYNKYWTACPGVERYFIPELVVSTIPFEHCVLTFSNDSLVSIQSMGSTKIEEAINTKYGEGKKTVDKKEVTCTYTYTGAQNTKEETRMTTVWRDDAISCTAYFSAYYDSKCEKQYINDFTLELKGTAMRIRQCDAALYKEEKAKDKEKLKKDLDGF